MLSTLVESYIRLENHAWTDQEIQGIADESLVRLAFRSSRTLREQHLSEGLFVAHWLGMRRRYGLTPKSNSDAAGPPDQQLRHEWEHSPALRTEFNNSFGAYAAFLRASRRGQVRIAASRTITGKKQTGGS